MRVPSLETRVTWKNVIVLLPWAIVYAVIHFVVELAVLIVLLIVGVVFCLILPLCR